MCAVLECPRTLKDSILKTEKLTGRCFLVNQETITGLSEKLEKEKWLERCKKLYEEFCDPAFVMNSVSEDNVETYDDGRNGPRKLYAINTKIPLFRENGSVSLGSVYIEGHKEAVPILFLTEQQVRIIRLVYKRFPIAERKHLHKGEEYQNGETHLCFASIVQFLKILSLLSTVA